MRIDLVLVLIEGISCIEWSPGPIAFRISTCICLWIHLSLVPQFHDEPMVDQTLLYLKLASELCILVNRLPWHQVLVRNVRPTTISPDVVTFCALHSRSHQIPAASTSMATGCSSDAIGDASFLSPTAASASFCEYGSTRKARSLANISMHFYR